MRSDFHTHSTFSDGANTPAEMAEAALALGMTDLGFSEHSYTAFDTSCCMAEGADAAYQAAIHALAAEYSGRMNIYCGLEQDLFSPPMAAGYDYVIGSVHYLLLDGHYYTVDWLPESLHQAAERLGGDMLAVAEVYYSQAAQVVEVTGCDLIGHFDLIAKLNDRHHLFDPTHPRYIAAWQRAADRLLATGCPFEINTGAISRGYKTLPYPSPDILRYLAQRGATFVLSSDSHQRGMLCFGFDEAAHLAAQAGATLLNWKPPRQKGAPAP